MGFALLLLGDDRASITWNERCLTANAETPSYQRAWRYSQIACAHARNGDIRAARIALAETVRLAPHDTVRSHYPELLEPTYMAQIEGFRRASGLRACETMPRKMLISESNPTMSFAWICVDLRLPRLQARRLSGQRTFVPCLRGATQSLWTPPLTCRGHRSPVPSDWKNQVEAAAFLTGRRIGCD